MKQSLTPSISNRVHPLFYKLSSFDDHEKAFSHAKEVIAGKLIENTLSGFIEPDSTFEEKLNNDKIDLLVYFALAKPTKQHWQSMLDKSFVTNSYTSQLQKLIRMYPESFSVKLNSNNFSQVISLLSADHKICKRINLAATFDEPDFIYDIYCHSYTKINLFKHFLKTVPSFKSLHTFLTNPKTPWPFSPSSFIFAFCKANSKGTLERPYKESFDIKAYISTLDDNTLTSFFRKLFRYSSNVFTNLFLEKKLPIEYIKYIEPNFLNESLVMSLYKVPANRDVLSSHCLKVLLLNTPIPLKYITPEVIDSLASRFDQSDVYYIINKYPLSQRLQVLKLFYPLIRDSKTLTSRGFRLSANDLSDPIIDKKLYYTILLQEIIDSRSKKRLKNYLRIAFKIRPELVDSFIYDLRKDYTISSKVVPLGLITFKRLVSIHAEFGLLWFKRRRNFFSSHPKSQYKILLYLSFHGIYDPKIKVPYSQMLNYISSHNQVLTPKPK